MVPHTRDGRVMFAIPWHGHVVVGTTDTADRGRRRWSRGRSRTRSTSSCDTASDYLARRPTRADVLSVFAGHPAAGARRAAAAATAALSRDHTIQISASGPAHDHRRQVDDLPQDGRGLRRPRGRRWPGSTSVPARRASCGSTGPSRRAGRAHGPLAVYGSDARRGRGAVRERPAAGRAAPRRAAERRGARSSGPRATRWRAPSTTSWPGARARCCLNARAALGAWPPPSRACWPTSWAVTPRGSGTARGVRQDRGALPVGLAGGRSGSKNPGAGWLDQHYDWSVPRRRGSVTQASLASVIAVPGGDDEEADRLTADGVHRGGAARRRAVRDRQRARQRPDKTGAVVPGATVDAR